MSYKAGIQYCWDHISETVLFFQIHLIHYTVERYILFTKYFFFLLLLDTKQFSFFYIFCLLLMKILWINDAFLL